MINRQKNECVIKMAEPPAREFASCPDHYEALSWAFEETFPRIDFTNYRVTASRDGEWKVDRKGVIFTVIAIAFGIFLGSKGVPLGDAMRAVRSDH